MLIVVWSIDSQAFEIVATAEDPLERLLEGITELVVEIGVDDGVEC